MLPEQVAEPVAPTGNTVTYNVGRRLVERSATIPWKVTRDRPPERAKKLFVDGTHRTCAPEETLERIRPHFATAGITRIADVSGLDRIPISTVIAHRPNGRTLAAGSGKGFTKVAATVSAAMEAVELHCAEYPELDVTVASYAELAERDPIVDVADLALTRNSIFSTSRPEQWVQGWDLMGQCVTWVPLNMVRMGGVRMESRWSPGSFQTGSNGLASGNVMLEGVLAAVYEVIERDATTSWSLVQHHKINSAPTVDLSTIDDPLPLDLIDRLDSVNIDVVISDDTVDTNVPTYRATIYDRNGELGIYSGMGTHLDPGIALVRAITEAVQGRVVYIAGSRDDLFDHRRYMVNRDMGEDRHKHLDPLFAGETVSAQDRQPAAAGTFEEDLSTVVDRLRAAGLQQVIVVDLTSDEMGIPVVRAVIPGLEGYPFPHYQMGPRARRFVEAQRTTSRDAAAS